MISIRVTCTMMYYYEHTMGMYTCLYAGNIFEGM